MYPRLRQMLYAHKLWLEDSSHPDARRFMVDQFDEGFMRGVNFVELGPVDLRKADFYSADLRNVNFTGSNLGDCSFYGANLKSATLSNCDLTGAELRRTVLTDAVLSEAVFDSKTNLPDFQIVPQKGEFTCFKKVNDNSVLELVVSKNAKRTSTLVGRKCRASKVKVVGVVAGKQKPEFHSRFNPGFVYRVGKWVEEPEYNDDIRVECTKGIHFFMTQIEAERY